MRGDELRKVSPGLRMQRQAFLLMRARASDADFDGTKQRRYASLCHEIALLLRAHGLAQTVAVLSLDTSAQAFIDDFRLIVNAGLAGGAPSVEQWRAKLCHGAQRMGTGDYILHSRLALRAADAMKAFTESVLGLDRAAIDGAWLDAMGQGALHA